MEPLLVSTPRQIRILKLSSKKWKAGANPSRMCAASPISQKPPKTTSPASKNSWAFPSNSSPSVPNAPNSPAHNTERQGCHPMKKFRFPLDPLLQQRRHIENERARAAVCAQTALQNAETQL